MLHQAFGHNDRSEQRQSPALAVKQKPSSPARPSSRIRHPWVWRHFASSPHQSSAARRADVAIEANVPRGNSEPARLAAQYNRRTRRGACGMERTFASAVTEKAEGYEVACRASGTSRDSPELPESSSRYSASVLTFQTSKCPPMTLRAANNAVIIA